MIQTKKVMGGHGTAKELRTNNFIEFGLPNDYCFEMVVRSCK